MRAVVDAGVLLTGLIRPRGPTGSVLGRLREGRFVLVVSRAIVDEIGALLSGPWLRDKYGIVDDDAETFLRFLPLRAELVTPEGPLRRCREARNDRLLEAAVAGRADRLVTGDAELLALRAIEGAKIVDPTAFVAEVD